MIFIIIQNIFLMKLIPVFLNSWARRTRTETTQPRKWKSSHPYRVSWQNQVDILFLLSLAWATALLGNFTCFCTNKVRIRYFLLISRDVNIYLSDYEINFSLKIWTIDEYRILNVYKFEYPICDEIKVVSNYYVNLKPILNRIFFFLQSLWIFRLFNIVVNIIVNIVHNWYKKSNWLMRSLQLVIVDLVDSGLMLIFWWWYSQHFASQKFQQF